jgi:protein-tyrosine phosphatase
LVTIERHIPFERVYNFRDLGGYPTRDGRVVRWRRLFRSGELQRMSAEEAEACRQTLRIATVIDFRSEDEASDPRGFGALCTEPARRFHFPMGNARSKYEARESGHWEPEYVAMLDGYGDRWAGAVRLLADEATYPAVFHCVTGKDRTGVMAALVLDVLGVAEEAILRDYAVSQEHMELLVQRLRATGAIKPDEPANPALGVSAPAMAEMLHTLRERYGSARAFLGTHGLEADVFDRMEALLLEEPAP